MSDLNTTNPSIERAQRAAALSVAAGTAPVREEGAAVANAVPTLVNPQTMNTSSLRWWNTRRGRIGTRIFSRGMTGSLMYALGSIAVERGLAGYAPELAANAEHYDQLGLDNSFMSRLIRSIARGIDHTITPAIKSLFGEGAVLFRETRYFQGQNQLMKTLGRSMPEKGRTLGHEIVDVTFNFACASIGDATGRNIVKLVDPNEPLSWMENNHFNGKKFWNSQMKAAWKVLSYNQAEDWFAALPYVYLMKAQRHVFENHTGQWGKGFKYVFDYGNSNALKVDKQGNKTGDYYWQNALDYQLRFTYYNIFTLMFREMYNSIGSQINAWVDGKTSFKDLRLPTSSKDAVGFAGHSVLGGVRYLARSIIKGFITMTPTVPFFWFFRTSQASSRALAINAELGPMVVSENMLRPGLGAPNSLVTPNFREIDGLKEEAKLTDGKRIYHWDAKADKFTAKLPSGVEQKFEVGFNEILPNGTKLFTPAANNPFRNSSPAKAEGKYAPWIKGRWYDSFNSKGMGGFRRLSMESGRVGHNVSQVAYNGLNQFSLGLDIQPDRTQHLHRATLEHVNSALAYTPYFSAKTEFAQVDTVALDRGIDRTLNGVGGFNLKETARGVVDTVDAIRHPEKSTGGLSSVFASNVKPKGGADDGWFPWASTRKPTMLKDSNTLFSERLRQRDETPLDDVVRYRLEHGWAKGEQKRKQRIEEGIHEISQLNG